MSRHIVGAMVDGEPEYHAPGVIGDYSTLCGLDINDPEIGHDGEIKVPRGQKITCRECYEIWRDTVALNLRKASFDVGAADALITRSYK